MAEETLADELTQEEMDELDKLAYTHKRYLTPKEIAAYVLVNFGQKNLTLPHTQTSISLLQYMMR